jgi:hypothetical protein
MMAEVVVFAGSSTAPGLFCVTRRIQFKFLLLNFGGSFPLQQLKQFLPELMDAQVSRPTVLVWQCGACSKGRLQQLLQVLPLPFDRLGYSVCHVAAAHEPADRFNVCICLGIKCRLQAA